MDDHWAALWSRLEANFDDAFDDWCMHANILMNSNPDAYRDTIITFHSFYLINAELELEKNVPILTKLATVFAGEAIAINEYSRICYLIKSLLQR